MTATQTRPRLLGLVEWRLCATGWSFTPVQKKVLEQMLEIWPDADVFPWSTSCQKRTGAFLKGRRSPPSKSCLCARTKYCAFAVHAPLAIEQLDLSGYDLVVSYATP